MELSGIPVIDVGPALDGDPAGMARVAARLDEVYTTLGFGFIANHGIDSGVVEGVFAASRAFHALPRADKEAIAIDEAHRGFIQMASSTIVTSSVDAVRRPNQSESFMVMHEQGPGHPDVLAGVPLSGPNQWPAALPEIRGPIEAYVEAMRDLCRRLSRVVALAIAGNAAALDAHFEEPVTFLRLLWYPEQPADAPDDLYGAAPHTDYGFLTLLAQDDHPGLAVRTPGGEWLDVPVAPGLFVMNSADILQRWSNGRWVSTPHRVVNRSGAERYSVPFFYDPHMNTVVRPFGRGGAERYEPVVYGEYLIERLKKNYVRHADRA